MAKQKTQENIFLPRTRLHPIVDRDIIDWLALLNKDGYGKKGLTIKETLRTGIKYAKQQQKPQSQASTFGDKDELLGNFRLIIEASLESHLSGLQLTGITKKEIFDSETEDILDNFASLMI